ncbi:hypothetical protein Rsub_00429 [Raphidocelis subcapitata]|uniref:Uncharacterized protein n=1 Tax=Raphidocelis subcapitata TaxID=307507 RepID=A0A2V0NKA5_9CHLO|nr:hypothetical protein Rsub_00429 [Raphidocelis subcapitata]|eukprot:GBF87718.1 hypothetical protein Rsub_00429 [Raphidocelis subcapitata]
MSSPFSKQAVAAAAAGAAGGKQPAAPAAPLQVPVTHQDAPADCDLYRTFSPSDVAFWDLRKPVDGSAGPLTRKWSGTGFFSKLGNLFGGSGGSTSGDK